MNNINYRNLLIHALAYSIASNILNKLGFPKESYFILGLIQGSLIAIEVYKGTETKSSSSKEK